MRRSSTLARIVTTVVTVPAVALAILLLSAGGAPFFQLIQQRFEVTGFPLGSLGFVVAGVLLLVVVGLLGMWSSAGLVTSGLLAVISLVLTLAPVWTVEVVMGVSRLPGRWPQYATYGLSYGTPLLITVPVVALGFTLALARRRASGGAGSVIGGLVLAPVLIGVGALLQVAGISSGLTQALMLLDTSLRIGPAVLTIAGSALVMIGVYAARWSPAGLVLPALVAATATALCLTPIPFDLVASADGAIAGPVSLLSVVVTGIATLVTGFGPGVAALFLAGTVSLLVVRARARRTAPTHRAGIDPVDGSPDADATPSTA